jgi:phytoene dehydrogenase-like protein
VRVVVIGGGLGGMASAARLAKLGHEVTLLEAADRLGGALRLETEEGFGWDVGAHSTLLPAVLRDLFRKSGRPAEKEIDLQPVGVIRTHRFEDGSSVEVPGGSRAAQIEAFDALAPGLGERWAEHVASYAEVWETLRRGYFEVPRSGDPGVDRILADRQMLHRRLRKDFKDERLQLVAGHRFVAEGHDLRNVPAWLGVWSYVEQRFGAWTIPGGFASLSDALAARLAIRKVTVLTGTPARDLVVRDGRAVGVLTDAGPVDADAVVCAIDPRLLPALAPLVRRTMPAIPPLVAFVGLEGDVPELGHELVLHGDPLLVLRTGGVAPAGHHAWTVHGRGRIAEDLLRALARHRIDVRGQVVVRIDRSPKDLVAAGSPMGLLWEGRGTVARRLGPDTPIPGLYAAGAHAAPGSGVPFTGLSAALVAQAIGPAS